MVKNEVSGTAKKGLFRIVFSRTGIILLLIALQAAVFIGMPLYLEEYMTYIYGATTILEVVCAGISDYWNTVLSVREDAVWISLYGASPGKTSD